MTRMIYAFFSFFGDRFFVFSGGDIRSEALAISLLKEKNTLPRSIFIES
jgi:hypothetical protein